MNYGEKQPRYTLDYISEAVLGLKKLEYKNKNTSLDDLYLNDPTWYHLYNIIDTILVRRLNEKLKHIDLHNTVRRMMRTPMTMSMTGNSALFDTYVFSKVNYVRYGISSENGKVIDIPDIEKYPIPKDNKYKIKPAKISSSVYQSIVNKFVGAYVKLPFATIINDGSLIIDLDASLPPWEKIAVKRGHTSKWLRIGQYEYYPGDQTLTWDKDNNVCWKDIKGKIIHDWDGNLITLTTEKHKIITVTSNHSIFAVQKESQSDTPYLIDASKLKIDDKVIAFNKDGDNIILEKIIKIRVHDYKGKVYDISVDETERFFAGSGIGAHNSSLYPSMINQSNISFDSYRARILPPSTYKTIKLLENVLGKGQIPDALSSSIFQMIATYVNEEDITKKGQTVTNTYYTFMYLFDALVKSGLPFNKISNPTTTHESILLKTYLLPLLDLVNIIHPSNKSFNQFSFDYIFDEKELENKYPEIYIVHDVGNSNLNLQKHSLAEATKFIKKYIITMAGTLFAKHEEKTGLFADFLQQMGNLRKHYKKTRDSHPKNSDEYSFYDARQTSVKIIMNTTKLMVLILMCDANLVNSGNISSR